MTGELIVHAVRGGLAAAAAAAGKANADADAAVSAGPATASAATSAAAGEEGDGRKAAAATRTGRAYVLPPPLGKQPPREGHLCFTFDAEGWQMLQGLRPSSERPIHQRKVRNVQGSLPLLSLVRGWERVSFEGDSGSRLLKPGIVARTPGAELRMEVDTSGVPRPVVTLHFLQSYERMGVVRVACARCACETHELDGHRTERVSTMSTALIPVSRHARCELQLLLLNRTSSGRHKWKLERLLVESLAAPAARGRSSSRVADGARTVGGA